MSEAFDDGEALLAAVTEQGLEGVVAKRRGSSYAQGKRTRDWLKLKAHARQEFVDRRLHARLRQPRLDVRVARPRRQRRRGAPVRGQRRDRVRRARDPQAAREAPPARAARSAVSLGAEDAARPEGRRRLGRAASRRRGGVQRVDARRARPAALVQGPARGQARRRGAARAAGERRRRRREARAAPLEPRQGLLARRGDHEGRPRRVLPPGRLPLSSRTCAAGRSRCAGTRTALSARRSSRRTPLRTCRTGSAPSATPVSTRERRRRRSSTSRSWTTSSRSSGW